MYGLLLEGILQAIKRKYGEKAWLQTLQKSGIPHSTFNIHKCYSETLIPRLTKAAMETTGATQDELMELFGENFVVFVGDYGYDRILRVLGRNLRDFLSGLDNLHEYLRFSYPKLKPPSFFVEDENEHGLTLHYRSRRKGYLYYVMGQIQAVGKHFYNTDINIEVLKEEDSMDMYNVMFRLNFTNSAFSQAVHKLEAHEANEININPSAFFDVFPFHIVFDRTMTIRNIGSGLQSIMPGVLNQSIDEMFQLTRPLVEFSLENVLSHTNNAFEMVSVDSIKSQNEAGGANGNTAGNLNLAFADEDEDSEKKKLKLKGQMVFMESWNAVLFIGTPIMGNLEKMFDTGLYINDLSLHDSSRELVLAGTQQQAELKMALDQEQQKASKLEDTMNKLDEEMKRTDSLLYQMIPRSVADRLRKGEQALNTCEIFEEVTILFSDVVGFTKICSNITPMSVVSLLNDMYTKFDKLTEKHKVYKVETIGDAYMVVSGAPDKTKYHAVHVADLAFGMLDTMKELLNPGSNEHLRIRIGVHSGMVVAGVVGLKMPRWCLFGDTVNVANRMEATGESMRIQISETTKKCLSNYTYITEERGEVEVKPGDKQTTYWLVRRDKTPQVRVSLYNLAQTSTQFAFNALDQNIIEEQPPMKEEKATSPKESQSSIRTSVIKLDSPRKEDQVEVKVQKTLKSKSSRSPPGLLCFSRPNKVQVITVTHPDEDIPRIHDEVTIGTNGERDSKLCCIM